MNPVIEPFFVVVAGHSVPRPGSLVMYYLEGDEGQPGWVFDVHNATRFLTALEASGAWAQLSAMKKRWAYGAFTNRSGEALDRHWVARVDLSAEILPSEDLVSGFTEALAGYELREIEP